MRVILAHSISPNQAVQPLQGQATTGNVPVRLRRISTKPRGPYAEARLLKGRKSSDGGGGIGTVSSRAFRFFLVE